MATLKGKTKKRKTPAATSTVTTSLPPFVLDNHCDVTLCVDYCFVQNIPFLQTISRKINFRTVTQVDNRTKDVMLHELKLIIRLYKKRRFRVNEIKADLEFKCLENLLPATIDCVAADDHVGEIERANQTTKADLRTLLQGLPFTRVPKLLVTEVLRFVVKSRNQFPSNDGISTDLSPLSIVTGAPLPTSR